MKDIEKVSLEIQQAREKYDYFNSTHEVYGVLKEEVDEFWDEVKTKENVHIGRTKSIRRNLMIAELTQIAAISLRAIDEIKHDNIKWI